MWTETIPARRLVFVASNLLLCLCGLGQNSQAQEPGPGKPRIPAKEGLTPATFSKFQALIRPQAHEWRHLRVRWLTDIVAARKKGAEEDKPIIVLRTGGAGYNDPLGAC
jgi:hypothetical protein